MPTPSLRLVVFAGAGILLAIWNVQLAARVARQRAGTAPFNALTALAGMLVAPGALVALVSTQFLAGQAVHSVAWLWPFTSALFLVQSVVALARGYVRPMMGLPVAIANALIAAAASARYALTLWADPHPVLPMLALADAWTLSLATGREALVSPLALAIPLLAPAWPARWRLARAFRAAVALVASAYAMGFISALPRAFHAALTFNAVTEEPMQERPRGDLALGLRLLPQLRDAPSGVAMRADLSLLDTLAFDAVLVTVAPDASTAAIDSLGRALEQVRRDSTILVVGLGYGARDRWFFARHRAGYVAARLATVERLVRELHPDIVLPFVDPFTTGRSALGTMSGDWVRAVLDTAARRTHRLRPRTRVGVSFSAFTPAERAVYQWAASPDSPLDVVGFSFYPTFDGGASLAARLRTAGQWMRGVRDRASAPFQRDTTPASADITDSTAVPSPPAREKVHWVFAAGANPRLIGEANQERALWTALSWATAQPLVRGFVVDGAGDYDVLTGLRTPGGRLRVAAARMARAHRALAEAATSR